MWWCPVLSRGRGVNESVVVSYSLEGEGVNESVVVSYSLEGEGG